MLSLNSHIYGWSLKNIPGEYWFSMRVCNNVHKPVSSDFAQKVVMEMACSLNSLFVNLSSILSITTACTGSDQLQRSCPSTLTQA